MSPALATILCAFGIAVLLYLDRQKAERVSYALWLPGLWIAISGTRPVSAWFGFEGGGNLGLDGSPADAAIFGLLIILGIGVVIGRSSQIRTLLAANRPIMIYFGFCLVSIAWSSHADASFKRWTKAIGDVVMALIVATDPAPVVAFTRLVSRLGMVLFPTSVLAVFYFGEIGRVYEADGSVTITALTQNKNSLGLMVLVIILPVLWNVRRLYIHKEEPNRFRRLVAQGTVLAFGLELFRLANCSTGKACFLLGAVIVFVLNLEVFKTRPGRVHAFCLGMLITAAILLFFGGRGAVAGALGRQSSLSGRTEIWDAVIRATSNPIAGAGFESFWNSEEAGEARRTLVSGGFDPTQMAGLQEAHNGYIEIYLQLGLIGVGLIAFVIFSGYKRACDAYRHEPEIGSLFLAYVIFGAVYGTSEAGFRTMCPNLTFLLIAILSATAVVSRGLSSWEQSRMTLETAEFVSQGESTQSAQEPASLNPFSA